MLESPCCHKRLSVKRTYSAGSSGQSQETICECGNRFAAVTILLQQIDQHGLGAFAAASQLRRGALRLRVNKRKLTQRQQ